MKLQVLSLLVILIAFTAVGQKTDSITKYNLRISTFNDSWGGGFTRIKDDYRSYGICTFIEMPNKFSINTQLSGFTNKVSKQPTNQTRLDELLISGKFLIKKDFFKYLDIYGIIGLYDLNNYHGENIQNSTHQLFGVSEVKLPYSSFRGTFYQLGTTLIASKFLLKSYSSTLLYLQPSIETFIIPDYYATFNPKLPIKLESTKGSSFSLAIGYQYSSLITTNPLLKSIVNIETGPTIDYQLNTGIFYLQRKLFLSNNYSVGTYGINILLCRKKINYKLSDVIVEAGNINGGNGYYCKYLWNKSSLLPKYLSYVAYNQFGTYLKKRLAEYPKVNGHYQQFGLGIEMNLLNHLSRFPIIPYAGISLGLKQESVYSGMEQIKSIRAYSPIAFGEIGLKLKPPGKLFIENTRWGLSLHYKYLHVFNRSNSELINTYNLPLSLGYFGAGIFINVDM